MVVLGSSSPELGTTAIPAIARPWTAAPKSYNAAAPSAPAQDKLSLALKTCFKTGPFARPTLNADQVDDLLSDFFSLTKGDSSEEPFPTAPRHPPPRVIAYNYIRSTCSRGITIPRRYSHKKYLR